MTEWLTPILGLLGGLFGGYLGSYVKKKGENTATREDLATLTRIAEDVKAAVADRSWDRQRQWEMKRDAILAMIQSLGLACDSLMYMAATYQRGRSGLYAGVNWEAKAKELSEKWFAEMESFTEKRFVVKVLVGKELDGAMGAINQRIKKLADAAMNGRSYDMDTDMPEVWKDVEAVRLAARCELGFPPEE